MKPFNRLKSAISRISDATGRLAPIVRSGLVAGVALAAVVYPIAAAGGLGVRLTTDLYESLPSELNVLPPAQTSYVYASDNQTLITMFYEEYRKYTPISEISPNLQRAVIASEDGRFYEHNGVDAKGIARAFVANQTAGTVAQGASTLTMQYVRMALRDSAQTPGEVVDATEQTSLRKIREIRLAIRLEKELTKEQILERYLNVAYFGHRAYGVFAASQIFFSKLPQDLTVVEAATLAGLVKAPSAFDPASDRTAATERRDYVINNMVDLGLLDPTEAELTKAEPIDLRITDPPNDCVSIPQAINSWGYFCDFLKSWWMRQPAFGATPGERADALRRGGYRIVTSIDPSIQDIAFREIVKREKIGSSYALGQVLVQPGTGLVKAMAVNRNYSLDQTDNGRNTNPSKAGVVPGNYPNTVNALLGGGDLPGYQAGSTFKIFTMLTALDQGLPLNTWIYSPYTLRSIYLGGDGEPGSCGGRWCPSNASGAMTGNQSMWSGFGKSVNTYFVQLEQKVGAQNAVRMAERLGLRWRTDIDQLQASPAKADGWGSFTLGVADTTPLEMANAYATVAADGRYCEPLPVSGITGPDGQPAMMTSADGTQAPVASPRCVQAVSVQAARAAADATRCVTGYGAEKGSCGGWSTAPGVYDMVGRPVGGKTGTTDDTRSAWFVAITPQLASASFMADPDNPFHATGDWNSYKPIEAVSYTLKYALEPEPVAYFTPPDGDAIGTAPKAPAPRTAPTNHR